jgi:hypothetical protein
MSTIRKSSASLRDTAFAAGPIRAMIGLALLAAPSATFAQAAPATNLDCTLMVPNAALTSAGLAKPYQLVATDPANGECHETNTSQSAFVQAAILDPQTGRISIYNPLVIDKGSTPAAAPVVPKLPANAVVALWFGYNGNNLTLHAAGDGLADSKCVQGLAQFAYCNAAAFFRAAHDAIRNGQVDVPALGFGNDGRPCPSVRSFAVVDQDQSDNLPVSYLITPSGLMAQNTAQNLTAFFPSAAPTVLGNPSDNGLTDKLLDPALGCTPWEAPDLANPGHQVPALPLNELQANAHQLAPHALIPAGDPFVLNPTFTGTPDLAKVNEYRRGVDQPVVGNLDEASTARYCRYVREIGPNKLQLDRDLLAAAASPFPNLADSLFTFMAQRLVGTYDMLNCQALLNEPDRVTLFTNSQGIVNDATIK